MPKATSTKRSATAAKNSGRRRKTPPTVNTGESGSLCRVCANWFPDQSGMVSLESRTILESTATPAEVILAIGGGSPAVEGDGLPEFCCRECFDRLEEAYQVRNLCRESELKLRKMLDAGEGEGVVNPLEAVEVVCKQEEPEDYFEDQIEIKNEPVWEDTEENDNTVEYDGTEENVEDGMESKETSKSKRVLLISEDLYEEIPATTFRCCGCRLQFETIVEMKEHGLAAHGSKKLSTEELGTRVQCDVCCKVLRDIAQLNNHQAKEKSEFRCRTCGEAFINRVRVSTHYKTLHGPNANITGSTRLCCGCSEQVESLEALTAHSEAVHLPSRPPPNPERPFVCDICYHNFPLEQGLHEHKTRLTSKVKKYICSQCGKQYLYPGQLSDHEKTHLGEKVFKCTECPAAYVSRESLRKHIFRHSMPEDKFKCSECGRCYRSARNLKEHMNMHTGERPFACTYCPSAFARETSLMMHIKTHTGQKDHECSICGKRFGNSSSLRHHVNFFHKQERPFGCFFCERRYPRKDYRRRHMESVHAAELLANPVPAIELSGSTRWMKPDATAGSLPDAS